MQVSTRGCQPRLEQIPPLLPQGSSSRPPPHSRFCLAFAARIQRQLHLLAVFCKRQKKVPVRSLFSKKLARGQRGPYLHLPSRETMHHCSHFFQLSRGFIGHGRGVVALCVGKGAPGIGQVEQLLAELFILHDLPGQTRRKELLKSCISSSTCCLLSTYPVLLVHTQGRHSHPLPKASFSFSSLSYVQRYL